MSHEPQDFPPPANTVPVGWEAASVVPRVVVAALWLVSSIAVGVWLIVFAMSHEAGKDGELKVHSERAAYGGDAYTGIQNAAVDTERAVVASANAQASADAHLAAGLGVLVVGIGLTNFTVALRR